jgi:hypothetical protein
MTLTTRTVCLWCAAALLLLMTAVFARPAAAEPDAPRRIHLPLIAAAATGGGGGDCDLPQKQYGSLPVYGPPHSGDPATDPDFNLAYRGWAPAKAAKQLVVLGPVYDRKAPQLPGLFADRRTARISATYQRYRWDPACNCRKDTHSTWEATVLGLAVKPGETIFTPDTTYDIGGGYAYQVLFAHATGITVYIGRDDDFHGYVAHIEGVCVDPDLLRQYRKLHAAGRQELPALRAHEAFGRAVGPEIQVALRDTGHFLDPRSRNDWWQGR